MTTVLPLRIAALAALIVISGAVTAPSVFSAADLGTRGGASGHVTAIHSPGETTTPAPAVDAAPQYAFLDDSVVMTAFDTQEPYTPQVMGIHNAAPVIGFATPAVNAQPPQAFRGNGGTTHSDTPGLSRHRANGTHNAGQMGGSTAGAAGAQQTASLAGNDATTDHAQQPSDLNPSAGSKEADNLVHVAGPADADQAANVRPSSSGDMPHTGSPANSAPNTNPVVVVAKADGLEKAPPSDRSGATNPGTQAKDPAPATGTPSAHPVVDVAKAGGDDGLDPFIEGKGNPDLIEPPDWVSDPIAGGSAPGSNPGAACHSGGTCPARVATPNGEVPEPGSVALLGLGLGLMGLALSRRRRVAMASR